MIKGIGIDIESISEINKSVSDKNFLKKIFTDKEIVHCSKKKEPSICYAGKFCVKEAYIKANQEKIDFIKIECLNDKNGKPHLFIDGKKKDKVLCSISHTKEYATAMVIIQD